MEHNIIFRNVVKGKFGIEIKDNYVPDQTYINRLIASLNKVEANSYDHSYVGFISEYKYLKSVGIFISIKDFVDGSLNQLLWINTILESGNIAISEEKLEEEFDYETPVMLGNPWILDKVTKKGMFFRGDEPFQDSRVVINSNNIVDIILALSKVSEIYEQGKNDVVLDSTVNDSSLFKGKKLETDCINVLKEIKHPIFDKEGNFYNKPGMKSAIAVWFHKCKSLGFISNDFLNTRDKIAEEIEKLLHVKIESSLFGKDLKAKKYKEDIEQKLEQILQN